MAWSSRQLNFLHRFAVNSLLCLGMVGLGMTAICIRDLRAQHLRDQQTRGDEHANSDGNNDQQQAVQS